MFSREDVLKGNGMPAPGTLGELPAHAAGMAPDKPAVITSAGTHTFRELASETDRLAKGLAGAGLGPGEKVAILLPNGLQYLHSYFAIACAGAIPVPINTFLAAPEVASVVADCEATFMLTTRKRLAELSSRLAEFRSLRTIVIVEGEGKGETELPDRMEQIPYESLAGRAQDRELPPPPDPDDLAVLTYTSGTTGRIKGVQLSHANLLSNARSCLDAVKLGPKDRLLLFLPMFHSLTQTVCIILPRLACLSVVLLPGVDRTAIRSALKQYRPTIFLAVPAIYAAMADNPPGLLVRTFNPIRVYLSGAAPLPVDVMQRFEKGWRRPLSEGYGLSEASPVVCLNPVSGKRKAGSVGPPVKDVEVKVIDGNGAEVATGEVGEIKVRGPNVMSGYFNRPEETAAAIKGGWLHTGDLGRLDEDGYLFVVGRQKEMLIFRGMNVYPREIEEVLAGHPAVAEAAVVGMEDPQKGEVPMAAVKLRPGASATEKQLKNHCKSRLARYKIPVTVRILDDLPRNPTGKVMKGEVRDLLIASAGSSSLNPPEEQSPDT